MAEGKNLHDWASMAEIGSFILNVSGIILPLVASLALSVQKESVVIPFVNIELGMWFQTTLLICSLLLWLQFVRNFWDRNIEKRALNRTYWKFMLFELTVRFPSFIVPLVVIISALIFVNPVLMGITGFFLLIGILTVSDHIIRSNETDIYYDEWNNNKKYREMWVNRITSLLEDKNYVETEDFTDFGLNLVKSWDEINTIIEIYFHIYETHLNLRKSPVTIVRNTIDQKDIFGRNIKVVLNSYMKTSIWIVDKQLQSSK